jgi:hypothetical protein
MPRLYSFTVPQPTENCSRPGSSAGVRSGVVAAMAAVDMPPTPTLSYKLRRDSDRLVYAGSLPPACQPSNGQ